MVVKLLILATLALPLAASGQAFTFRDIPFMGQFGSTVKTFQNPTNIAGSPPMVQWVTKDYYTNSSVPTVTNRWTANTTWSLTNLGAASTYPKANTNLNGNMTIFFDDAVSSALVCAPFTAAQPQEIFMVINWNGANNSGNNSYLFDATSAVTRNFGHQQGNTTEFAIGAVTETSGASQQLDYDNWIVIDMIFTTTGTGSSIRTNDVEMSTGDIGSLAMTGFTLGVDNALANPAAFQIAQIIVYPALLSAANRTSNYNYYTNFYKIRQP